MNPTFHPPILPPMTADFLIDSRSPEVRHRTGITAPDAFPYLRTEDGAATVYFDGREYAIQKERLERAGTGVRIEQIEPYQEKARAVPGDGSLAHKTVSVILREKGITELRVSPNLPYAWALYLQGAGFALAVHDFPAERTRKTEAEIERMVEAQRVTEGAFALAKNILSAATIDGANLRHGNDVLTSEYLKAEIKAYFLRQGYSCPESLIVASGEQTARPHDEGSGPILANVPIIIDLFPQNDATGYFADMTRTFVKGTPSPEAKKILDAVTEVQAEVAAGVKAGDTGDAVYRRTVDAFSARGFETSKDKGFMHGTGHGLGLAVHELPNLKPGAGDPLGPGHVVTVEPGLYYPGVGGSRIEDVVVFHADGRAENITRFPTDYLLP